MKNIKLLSLLAALLFISPTINAENYHWLVSKMLKLKSPTTSNIVEITKGIKKGEIVVVPVIHAAKVCDFSQSIITYSDNIKRQVASCSFNGSVRGRANS